jgi:hypothetical protein
MDGNYMNDKQTMYHENRYFPNVFVGCGHDCVYCKPSFQAQAKRQMHRCNLCYNFLPHLHPERLTKRSPKTVGDQFVFFPKGGDIVFASSNELAILRQYIEDNSQTTFLVQSKNPKVFWELRPYPDNLILGITLETNRSVFNGDLRFRSYSDISKAPLPDTRGKDFLSIPCDRKFITVEPILEFNLEVLAYWIKAIAPKAVYVGYDTKGCGLPEPKLAETLELIQRLRSDGFVVREKTLRVAWYEKPNQQTLEAVVV